MQSPHQKTQDAPPVSGANDTQGTENIPYTLLGVLLTLYFAQGMPSGFITQALPAILRDYNVSLEMIGLSGLLLAPWALKFLWAPVVDRYFSPKWGRSRSWIIPLQLFSAVIMVIVGLFNPHQLSSPMMLWMMYGLLFLLGLTGATHDVAADGLATRSLSSFRYHSHHNSDNDSHNVPHNNCHNDPHSAQQANTTQLDKRFEETSTSKVSDPIDVSIQSFRKPYAPDPDLYPQSNYREPSHPQTFHPQSMGENDDFVEVSQSIALDQRQQDSVHANVSEVPNHPYRGMGNAVQVIGYRLGLIIGGGVFLMVLGSWSWRYSFFALAGLILLNTLPIWRYAENKRIPINVIPLNNGLSENPTQTAKIYDDVKTDTANMPETRKSVKQYLQDQYGYFWHNTEMRGWLMVLLTFKVVDGISSGMVKPMMVDMGISTASIGLWASVLGSVAALLGAAVAAWVLKRWRHHTALLAFYVFQVFTTALYVLVAIGYEYPKWLGMWPVEQTVPFWWAYAANGIEHFSAALALVAMLTMVMHYARHDKAGSDFTTQVCLLTIFSGGSHLLSGFIAGQLGYTLHFTLSVGLGVICLLPLWYWRHCFIKNYS